MPVNFFMINASYHNRGALVKGLDEAVLKETANISFRLLRIFGAATFLRVR
jgi:hypothetical protein